MPTSELYAGILSGKCNVGNGHSLTLMEEHRQMMFENSVLKRMSESKTGKVKEI
jgi:hypothetical protein